MTQGPLLLTDRVVPDASPVQEESSEAEARRTVGALNPRFVASHGLVGIAQSDGRLTVGSASEPTLDMREALRFATGLRDRRRPADARAAARPATVRSRQRPAIAVRDGSLSNGRYRRKTAARACLDGRAAARDAGARAFGRCRLFAPFRRAAHARRERDRPRRPDASRSLGSNALPRAVRSPLRPPIATCSRPICSAPFRLAATQPKKHARS